MAVVPSQIVCVAPAFTVGGVGAAIVNVPKSAVHSPLQYCALRVYVPAASPVIVRAPVHVAPPSAEKRMHDPEGSGAVNVTLPSAPPQVVGELGTTAEIVRVGSVRMVTAWVAVAVQPARVTARVTVALSMPSVVLNRAEALPAGGPSAA